MNLAWSARGLARDDLCVSLNMLDLVLLEEESNTTIQRARNIARTANDFGPIQLDVLWVNLKAHVRAVLECFRVDAGRMQQGFGWNASPVQAYAAKLGALDAHHFLAKLRRANCSDIAAGSAADHDEVIMLCVCHGSVPRVGKCR